VPTPSLATILFKTSAIPVTAPQYRLQPILRRNMGRDHIVRVPAGRAREPCFSGLSKIKWLRKAQEAAIG